MLIVCKEQVDRIKYVAATVVHFPVLNHVFPLSGTVDMLKTTMVDKIPNDLEGMEASMERLLVLIGDIHRYVDDVVVRLISLFVHNSCPHSFHRPLTTFCIEFK